MLISIWILCQILSHVKPLDIIAYLINSFHTHAYTLFVLRLATSMQTELRQRIVMLCPVWGKISTFNKEREVEKVEKNMRE